MGELPTGIDTFQPSQYVDETSYVTIIATFIVW